MTATPLPFPNLAPIPVQATHAESAAAFAAANPELMAWWADTARSIHAEGDRVGMKHLVEVARWEHRKIRRTDETFRLNNNWTSHLVRIITATHPDLADVFELRELRAA